MNRAERRRKMREAQKEVTANLQKMVKNMPRRARRKLAKEIVEKEEKELIDKGAIQNNASNRLK